MCAENAKDWWKMSLSRAFFSGSVEYARQLLCTMAPYTHSAVWTVNDVLVDPCPFLFWSIHTLFTALKGNGSTKTKKGMDRPRRHWRSTLYVGTYVHIYSGAFLHWTPTIHFGPLDCEKWYPPLFHWIFFSLRCCAYIHTIFCYISKVPPFLWFSHDLRK